MIEVGVLDWGAEYEQIDGVDIEVLDTSLSQDVGMKADLYAHYGVQE